MNNGYESVSPPWSSEYLLEDFNDEYKMVPQFNAESERVHNLNQSLFQCLKKIKQNVQSSVSSEVEKNNMIRKVYDLLACLKDHIQPEKKEAIVNAINSMLLSEDAKPTVPCIDLCSSDDEDIKPNDSYYSMLQSISTNTPHTSRILLPNPLRRKKPSKTTNKHRSRTDNVRQEKETNPPETDNKIPGENEIDLDKIISREKEKTFFDFIDKLLANDSNLYKDNVTVNDSITSELPIDDIDLNKNNNEEKEITFFDFIDNLIVNEKDTSEDGNSVNKNVDQENNRNFDLIDNEIVNDSNIDDCDISEMPRNESIEKGATTPVYVGSVQDFESFYKNRSVNISPQSTSSDECGEHFLKDKESVDEKLSKEMIEEIIGAKINKNLNGLRLKDSISKNTYVQNEESSIENNLNSGTRFENMNNMANLEYSFFKNNNKNIKNKRTNIEITSVQIIRNIEIARGSHVENIVIQNNDEDFDNLVQQNDMENIGLQNNEKDIENTLLQQTEEENIVVENNEKNSDNTVVHLNDTEKTEFQNNEKDFDNTLFQQNDMKNTEIQNNEKDFNNTLLQQSDMKNTEIQNNEKDSDNTLFQQNMKNIVVQNNEKDTENTLIQQNNIENIVIQNNKKDFEYTLVQNNEENVVKNNEKIIFDTLIQQNSGKCSENITGNNEKIENTLIKNEESNIVENTENNTVENTLVQNEEENNVSQNSEENFIQNIEQSIEDNIEASLDENMIRNNEKIILNTLVQQNENTPVQENEDKINLVKNNENIVVQNEETNNERKIENQLVKQNITKNNLVQNNKKIIKYTNIPKTETDIKNSSIQKEEDCDVLKALNDEIKGFESSLLNEKNILYNMQNINNVETEKLKLKTAMKKSSLPFTGNKLKKHVTFAKFKKVKYLDTSLGQELNSKPFDNNLLNNSKCDTIDIEENKSGNTMRKKLYAFKSRCNYMNYKRKSCSSKTKSKISFQRPEEKRPNEKYRSNNEKIVICNDSKINNVQRCNLSFFNSDNNKTLNNNMKNEEKKISKNSLNFSVENLILNDKNLVKEQKIVVEETNQQNKTIKTAASRKCYDFNTPQHLKTFDNTHLVKTLDQLPCFDNKYKHDEVINEKLLKNNAVVKNESKPDSLKKTANTYNCMKIDAQTRYLETPPHSETDVEMKVDEPCNLGFETPPYNETKTDTAKNQTDECPPKSNDASVSVVQKNKNEIDLLKTEVNKTIEETVEENERPKRKKNLINTESNDPVTKKSKARIKKSKENCPEIVHKFEKLNMPLKIRRKRHLADFQSEIKNDTDLIQENKELNTVEDKLNSNNGGKNLKKKMAKNKKDLNQIIDNLISAKNLKFQNDDTELLLNNNKLVKPKSIMKRPCNNLTEQKNKIEIPNKKLKLDKITSRQKNKSNIVEVFYDKECKNDDNDKPSENTENIVEKLKNENFVLPVVCLTDVCKDPKFLKHLERTTIVQKISENCLTDVCKDPKFLKHLERTTIVQKISKNVINTEQPDINNSKLEQNTRITETKNNDKDVFGEIINEKENNLNENMNEEATTENIVTETPINNEFENSGINIGEEYMNPGDNNIMLSACNLFDSSLLIDNNEQANITEEKNDNYNENNTKDTNPHDPVMTSASCKIGEDNLKILNLYEENSNQSEIPEQGAEVEIGFEQSYSEDLSCISNFYGTQKVDNFMNFVQNVEKPKNSNFESSYLSDQLITNIQNNHFAPSLPKNIKDNQSNNRQEQDYIYTDKLKYTERSELKSRNQQSPTKSKRVTTMPRYKPSKTRYDDVEDLSRSRHINYISEPKTHSNMERNGLVKTPLVNQPKTYHKKYGLNHLPSSENKRNTEKQLNDLQKSYRNTNNDYIVKDRTYDFHEENYNCPSYSDYNKTRKSDKKDKVIIKYNIPVVQSSGRGGNTRYDRTLDNCKRKKSDDGSYAWRFKVPCDSNEHLFPN